jgi:hypothetical protein
VSSAKTAREAINSKIVITSLENLNIFIACLLIMLQGFSQVGFLAIVYD